MTVLDGAVSDEWGGEQPNVIPSVAGCWWYFRDPTAEGARTLFGRRGVRGRVDGHRSPTTADVLRLYSVQRAGPVEGHVRPSTTSRDVVGVRWGRGARL